MITNIKSAPATININYKKLPRTVIYDKDEFNELYFWWRDQGIAMGIERTKSGGIKLPVRLPRFDVVTHKNLGFELIALAVIDGKDMFYRVQLRTNKLKVVNSKNLDGRQAMSLFVKELQKDGVNITKRYINNGLEIKKAFPKIRIELLRQSYIGMIFDNAHHMDINNSFPAGMAKCCPEWKKTIERLYYGRREHPEYKQILVIMYGMCQSSLIGYKLAHVAKYAVELNNRKVDKMIDYLKSVGCTPIAVNSDGIWYTGPLQDQIDSDKLGWWRHDHKNCKLRYKSDGCYEFIENGKYYPVVRGTTDLDKVKERGSWQWGDIFRNDAAPIDWVFDVERGVVRKNG